MGKEYTPWKIPMSEQAASKEEALKEPVQPHQPGQSTFRAILAEGVEWKPFAAFPPEARLAVLVGRPLEPGPYTIRVKVPNGVKLMPHWHPEDRVYTVISGVFYIGLGDKFDADQARGISTRRCNYSSRQHFPLSLGKVRRIRNAGNRHRATRSGICQLEGRSAECSPLIRALVCPKNH